MIETKPIVSWPGPMTPRRERKPKRYDASPLQTRKDLVRELDLIGARSAFLQGAYREDQIRLDGIPRSGALPEHPGIIVTYTMPDGAMYDLPCDTYQHVEQNLRAIVLTLQRLRLVEESGVKTQGRQYEGFKRLEGGTTSDAVEGAALVLAAHCDGAPGAASKNDLLARPDAVERAYKIAATRTHPDRNGGDASRFNDITRAKQMLDTYHANRKAAS